MLSLALAALTAALAPADTVLTLDDLRAVRTFPAHAVSPAGDRIAYVLDEPAPDGRRRSDLWVVPAAGGSPRRVTEVGDAGGPLRWSADGRIAFLRGNGAGEVWTVDPERGPPRQSALAVGGIRDLGWSPDGKALAVVAGSPEGGRGEGIYLAEPGGATGRWLLPPDRHGLSFGWSPDGRRIAFSAQREAGFYGQLESDLYEIELADGSVRRLVERPGMDRDPVYAPDGERIAFVSGFGETGMLAALGVAVVDRSGALPRDLPATGKGSFFSGPDIVGWAPQGDAVLYTVADGLRWPLESVAVEDGAIRRVSRDSTSLWSGYAIGGGTIAFFGERGDRPPELHASPLAAFRPARLTSANAFFRALDGVRYEPVRWRNSEGGTIEGLLLRPAGADGPLPLLTILHGGPAVAVGQGFWGLEFFNPFRDDLFAARGFAVLLPNPRGSAGYGAAFMRAVRGDWGTAPADDVLSGVDHLVATGVADPERLGLMGWSYGGYLTAWILTRTDRFAAASVGAGPVNLFSHFALGPRQMLDYFGAPPWEHPEPYLRNSPILFADRITTPTLIQHGEEDTAVSPSQSEELHTALRTVGIPVELSIYEGEGHVLRSPEAQERAWETTWAWFGERLLPGPGPSDDR